MYLGIDLGTSGIKVVITDDSGEIVDQHTAHYSVSRPQPLWSEQDPDDWWRGLNSCVHALKSRLDLSAIRAIGLSGQMHGATLVDQHGKVIRPAILWNDGRCQLECTEIEAMQHNAREIAGNLIMPGFTAPKLRWLQKHEPLAFSRIHKVLLPKDYLRFLMTGQYASDMSDAAGTMWLDVGKRCWHEGLLSTCGLHIKHMPTLFEGNQITAQLRPSLAAQWGMQSVPIVAGAGDNAAGAIGVGLVKPGDAMISLGTSGVYFVVSDGFKYKPESAVHSFCHALPNLWHLMSVHLSAASCLQWYSEQIVNTPVAELINTLENSHISIADAPVFLPYLSGERTPHNNPEAKGNFFGLTHNSNKTTLTHSILEGVSFALADGVDAVDETGVSAQQINLIGGGARSQYWRQMLADIVNKPICFRRGGDVGPALGAARLAQLASLPELAIDDVCPMPPEVETYYPNKQRGEVYKLRRQRFIQLYEQLQNVF